MRKQLYLVWVLGILAALVVYAVALWFGEVNQDEGWYLYAGRLVAQGKRPFLDFASTQGPVMAYVYALAQPFVRLWGVGGGRLFTAILGLATAFASAILAHRISRRTQHGPETPKDNVGSMVFGLESLVFPTFVPLLTFALLTLNLYHVYFTTVVKTYSLAGLFVILGFLSLERALRPSAIPPSSNPSTPSPPSDLRSPISDLRLFLISFLSAAFFALAAGVRLSAGILLPTIWLWLLMQWFRNGRSRDQLGPVLGFFAGGTVVLLAIYLPFLLSAPASLKFGLIDYHGSREVGGLLAILIYKAGFLIRLSGAYFPLIALGILCLILRLNKSVEHNPEPGTHNSERIPNSPPSSSGESASGFQLSAFSFLLLISFLSVTFVHLIAVFPYDDYQVFIMPLLAVLVSVWLQVTGYRLQVANFSFSAAGGSARGGQHPLPPPSALRPPISSRSRSYFCFLLSAFYFVFLLHSASSPLLQSWLLAERDRIWWPLRSETSLQTLNRSGQMIRNLSTVHSPPSLPSRPSVDNPSSINSEPVTRNSELLTFDTYLAVEAGMSVPEGMGLGPFCYFPDMERTHAERLHVLNREMLLEIISNAEPQVAAFSGYGLAIRCPEITPLSVDEQAELWTMILSRYEDKFTITPFGQADTTLRVLVRKPNTGIGNRIR